MRELKFVYKSDKIKKNSVFHYFIMNAVSVPCIFLRSQEHIPFQRQLIFSGLFHIKEIKIILYSLKESVLSVSGTPLSQSGNSFPV